MNNSGLPLREFINYFKIDIKDILVVYDDKDLVLGKKRIRRKGSSGGHNGIKSIISHLGTEEFTRLKIGIGSTTNKDTCDYVLSKFSKQEKEIIEAKIKTYIEEIEFFLKESK
jgi:PTH1 family peptidyl-tRNA hydrolase